MTAICAFSPTPAPTNNAKKRVFVAGATNALRPFFLRTDMEKEIILHVSAKKKTPQSISRSCKKTRFFAFFVGLPMGENAQIAVTDW